MAESTRGAVSPRVTSALASLHVPGIGDIFRPTRRQTRIVNVGAVGIGGDNPIRLQSMTNTDTMDTEATVAQTIRLVEAGCEIVRVTAPSIREAENLREIRRQLVARRIDVPLVADIHFTPNAALIAADLVEKVRINPGNYADKKKFEVRDYDDREYEAEIARVHGRFRPLVKRCKANGVAMRIGTNHGSLSDRIMNRFGDTAQGMVESALEFLDVCENESFYDVVFSMKASNTQVAIAAYRLLAARLEARAPGVASYPFHVGVTEAGDSEDGRIKSAIGIGSLLEDGLGDTIRVSLTEDPVREVPVARGIADRAKASVAALHGRVEPIDVQSPPVSDFFASTRRSTVAANWAGLGVAGDEPVRVELEVTGVAGSAAAAAARLATDLSALRDIECESLLVEAGATKDLDAFCAELSMLGMALPISLRVDADDSALAEARCVEISLGRWVVSLAPSVADHDIARAREVARDVGTPIEWELAAADHEIPALVRRAISGGVRSGEVAAFSLAATASLHDHRVLASALADNASTWTKAGGTAAGGPPIVLRQSIGPSANLPIRVMGLAESDLIDASVRLGGMLCDGIGDVVSLRSTTGAATAIDLAYRVLQGARQRTTRTEYISCPSCGRTLFDLEEITARIKARTDHLKGVKIAIMGCIVNGPGEMADADFGYVGSGVGQVTLYVGKQVVARAVPEAEATDRLVELIQEHGQWVEERA